MPKHLFYILLLIAVSGFILSCSKPAKVENSKNPSNSAEQKPNSSDAPKADAPKESENTERAKPTEDDKTPSSGAVSKPPVNEFENRCGWFSNPTPSNAWLEDRDGEWIISTQGGRQAEGDWPDFKPDQWIETNGSYGYGCACLRVKVDRKNMEILEIASSNARPLEACRKDPALKEPKE